MELADFQRQYCLDGGSLQAAFGGRADEGEIGLEKIEGTQFLSNLSRGVMSSFIRTQSAIAHKVRAAVRVSSNPLRAVLGGLWHMPMGARVLVENVAAALSHLRVKWRWWAASQSDKFLFITGMLVPGALQWPAVALRSTGWALPAVMNGVALIFVLILNWAMIFGRLSRADQVNARRMAFVIPLPRRIAAQKTVVVAIQPASLLWPNRLVPVPPPFHFPLLLH